MKIHNLISLLYICTIFIYPNAHASNFQSEPYFAYLTKVQDKALDIFKQMLTELPPQQAAKLKALGVKFTAAAPGDPNGWCSSPWEPALRSEYKGKPLIIICPYALSIFSDYFTAAALSLGSKIRTRNASAIQEINGMPEFIEETTEKLARFYLAKAATNYTQTMNGEENTRCPPSTIAYQVVHHFPLSACNPDENPKIAIWLKSFEMNENEAEDLWQRNLHEALSALIAHEIGHIMQENFQKGKKLNAVDEEIAADQFAHYFFNSSPLYIARQIILMNFEILWSHIPLLSLNTKYPLPTHETTRLEATAKMLSCEKYRTKKYGSNLPEFAELAKEIANSVKKYSAIACNN